MKTQLFELNVLVNGKPVREYSHDFKSFVEGRAGTQYSLRLKNNSYKRVLACFTVDGVNVINGKKGGDTKSGYIVNAYDSIEIKGFRTDDSSVSAFVFDSKSRSYANKIGAVDSNGNLEKTTLNCGVVGVRVYAEKTRPIITYRNVAPPIQQPEIYPWPSWISESNQTRCLNSDFKATSSLSNLPSLGGTSCCNYSYSAESATPDFNLGTTWGEQISDAVETVSFDSEDSYTDLVIYYDNRKSLEKAGIKFSNEKQVSFPSPFQPTSYCRIPKR